MARLGRIRRLLTGSRPDRAEAFRSLWRQLTGMIAFRLLGGFFNRPGSSFLLSFRPDFDYDFRRFPDYRALHRAWAAEGQYQNRGDLARLNLLYLNVKQVLRAGVPGDAVEVGVYKGNSARVLHELLAGSGRRLFLFDTFYGFDRADIVGVDATVEHDGFLDTTVEAVRNFVGADNTVLVPGLFPESAAGIALPEAVAILHVDCDLYAPMKAALELFYPRMRPGALFVLHDYASGHWPGATQAIDEFFSGKPESPVVMPDKSGSAVVRKV